MKNKKMLITLLLAIALVVLCGTTSKAYTATTTENGNTFAWRFDKNEDSKQITNLKCTNPEGISGEITIPSKITVDGEDYTVVSLCYGAFKNAKSITKVNIPDTLMSMATSSFYDDGAFENCTSLTEVNIGSKLSNIGNNCFKGCTALKSINIPDNITDMGSGTFWDCTGLEKCNIPQNVTVLKGATFFNCSSLKSIEIPGSVTAIKSNYNDIYNKYQNGCFAGCKSLTEVTIPDSVTIMEALAFQACTNLKKVKISNKIQELSSSVFANCKSLTEVTIPDSVVSIQSDTSGEGAFYNCEALQSVTIPDTVTFIGKYAFENCGKGKLGLFVKQGSYAENWAKDNNVSYNYGTGTNTDNSKDNKENSKEQSKDDSNKQNSNSQDKKENKVTLTGTDKTTATKVISKTGESAIVLVTIVLVAGIAIFVSRKLMNMKDIK